MVNLEKNDKKFFQRISLATDLPNWMYRNIFSLYLKSSRLTDGAWQQEGASLHLQHRAVMTYGSRTPKNCSKRFYNSFMYYYVFFITHSKSSLIWALLVPIYQAEIVAAARVLRISKKKNSLFSWSCNLALNNIFNDLIFDLSNHSIGNYFKMKNHSELYLLYFLWSLEVGCYG